MQQLNRSLQDRCDIISYSRRALKEETGIQWSVGSRIVGFEYDHNDTNPNRDPYSAWVICDGIPVLVAVDKIRPCTAAELLAYRFMHGEGMTRAAAAVILTQQQQSFLDERETSPPKRTRIDPDDERVVPRTPTRGNATSSSSSSSAVMDIPIPEFPFLAGVTAKELRANSPPNTPSKRDLSPSLAAQMKRNKVTGKGVEMLEKIAYLFDEDDKGNMSTDKVGFLQVRLIAPKVKKVTKKPMKAKDGDKNLAFASCSPEVQAGLRKSRVVEWRKWK